MPNRKRNFDKLRIYVPEKKILQRPVQAFDSALAHGSRKCAYIEGFKRWDKLRVYNTRFKE